MVHLAPITKDNWLDAISLEVHEEQKSFVASNAVSLAQLNFLNNFQAQGIFDSDKMVGFTLYGEDEEEQEFWMYRLMVDKNFQGRGYGKEAVQLVIGDIRKRKANHQQTLSLSYEPDNVVAKQLYASLDFQEVEGMVIDGEQVARYTF